jgi:hypothetical protein
MRVKFRLGKYKTNRTRQSGEYFFSLTDSSSPDLRLFSDFVGENSQLLAMQSGEYLKKLVDTPAQGVGVVKRHSPNVPHHGVIGHDGAETVQQAFAHRLGATHQLLVVDHIQDRHSHRTCYGVTPKLQW